jgi:hypothetical protein
MNSRDFHDTSGGLVYRGVQYMLLKRILFAVTGMLLLTCISRDNYWDPVNYSQIFGRNVRDSATARIDSGFYKLPLYLIDTIKVRLSGVEAANAIIQHGNDSQKTRNDTTLLFNSAAQEANNNLIPPLADFTRKRLLDTFFFLIVPQDTLSTILQSLESAVSLEKQRADTIIANTNTRASPVVIFTLTQRESILTPYDSILRIIDTLDARVTSLRTFTLTTNDDPIKPYNDFVKIEDSLIIRYNDSMISLLGPRVIPNNTDSLIMYLQNAIAGNTFTLADTTYSKQGTTIRFDHSGLDTLPIVVQGQTKTELNLLDVVLDANSYIIFKKVKFTATNVQCVLVQNGCTGIAFYDCKFSSNAGRGITILNSDVTMNNCSIENGTDGIFISSSLDQPRTVSMNNVLILSSTGDGITVSGTNLFIQYATILRNGGEAIYITQPVINFSVLNTIIANNGGANPAPAIYFEGGYTGTSPLSMTNVNMVQNGAGQDTVNAPVSGPILHYDPMFINEYDISPSSVLDSLEKAGTVIGYRRK